MMLGPTHRGGKAVASTVFVGRVRELKILQDALKREQMPGQYRVVSVHGVGGQGKSTLLERFRTQFEKQENPKIPYAIVDLASISSRDSDAGLLKVRNNLNHFGLNSPTFDLAFARLFKLTKPGRNLKEDHSEFFGAHGGLVGDLAEIAGTVFTELPGGKILFEAFEHLSERFREWSRRAAPIVSNLDNLSPQELQENLAFYLGYDICAFIEKDPPLRPVIFFDTFEALWQRSGGAAVEIGDSTRDAWIRRFAEETPGALFVVSGRRKLHWSEVNPEWDRIIIDCELNDLSDVEQFEFLNKKEVREEDVRHRIVQTSRGHALSLSLQVRTYQRICAAGRVPATGDFPATQREILDRFVDHLEPGFAAVLRIVAVSTDLDRSLWEYLAKVFPVLQLFSFTSVVEDELFRQVEGDHFRLHDVVRDHLVEYLGERDRGLLIRARVAIFEFHDQASHPDVEVRKRAGIAEGQLSREELDRHIEAAADQLVQANPARFTEWSLERLVAYQRAGIATRARPRLLREIKQRLLQPGTKPLALLAQLATVELAINPFEQFALQLADDFFAAVKGVKLTDEVKRALREISYHLVRAMDADRLRVLNDLLEPSDAKDRDTNVAALGVASYVEDRRKAAVLLARIVGETPEPSQVSEWYALCAACSAAPPELFKATVSIFLNRKDFNQTVSLIQILDTLLLRGAADKLSLVLETVPDSPRLDALIAKIEGENIPENFKVSICGLIAECLVTTGQFRSALDVLETCIPSRALEEISAVSEHWALDSMSRQDLITGLAKLGPAQFLQSLRGPAHLLRLRMTAESASGTDKLNPRVQARLNRLASLLERPGGITRVTIDNNVLDVKTEGSFSETKIKLLVNERSEIMVLIDHPLFCWRECDFLALIRNRLLFKDERQGVVFMGIEIQEKLMRHMVPGHRVLLVVMDTATMNPLAGYYRPVYDWTKASISFDADDPARSKSV